MKKTGLKIIAVFFAMWLVAGCSSAPMVYDKSVPLEQSSTITILNYHNVKTFDGKKVNWMAGLFNKKQVTIPAGQHSLEVYTERDYLGYRYFGTVTLTNNFLPSHNYFVYTVIDTRATKIYGHIFDETALLSYEGEPNPSNPNASPFEGKWVNTQDEGNQFIFSNNHFYTIVKGQYAYRGFFSYERNQITLPLQGIYLNNKWGIWYDALSLETTLTATYNGTTIVINKSEYRKVE